MALNIVSAAATRALSRSSQRSTGAGRQLKQTGFTLIEVIIALAIFATMTAALISISNSLNIVGTLRAYQISAWVADNHVEFARIDGLEKNLTYTTSLFGTDYISKIKPLEEPYKEIFPDDLQENGKITASVSAPSCQQVRVKVFREFASEPEFSMLACLFPRIEDNEDKDSR